MFSCNNRGSIFCDQTFWIIVIIAIIILWVHYSCSDCNNGCNDNCANNCNPCY